MTSPEKRQKIIIIDDDEGILDAFEAMLADSEFEFETSTNTDILLKFTKSTMPQLIIMDALLSGNDGREVCYHLKHNAKTKHIPVIMISAHPKAEEGAIKNGANAYLKKPFEMEELFALIHKWLLPQKSPSVN